jgi:hypothetical protein
MLPDPDAPPEPLGWRYPAVPVERAWLVSVRVTG